nr:hypothetical protein CFP56_31491 [Quercus suber]
MRRRENTCCYCANTPEQGRTSCSRPTSMNTFLCRASAEAAFTARACCALAYVGRQTPRTSVGLSWVIACLVDHRTSNRRRDCNARVQKTMASRCFYTPVNEQARRRPSGPAISA